MLAKWLPLAVAMILIVYFVANYLFEADNISSYRKDLLLRAAQLEALQGSQKCTVDSECVSVPYGSWLCGPEFYFAASNSVASLAEVLSLTYGFTLTSSHIPQASTRCAASIVAAPIAKCASGICSLPKK